MEPIFLLALITAVIGWIWTALRLRTVQRENRKQSERLNLLHKAIGAVDAGLFFYNVEKNESRWDIHTLKMFGLGGEERTIPPGTWESLLHPDDLEQVLNNMLNVLNGKNTLFNHTYRIILPNNKIRWIEGSGFVIRNDHGEPCEVAGFHFDVSHQVEHEQTLKDSELKAVQAMEAKTQFLANMSHEIRTPMNAIVGMIELLSMENPSPSQRRYLTTLQNSSDLLLRIINDILDVSKIEAGKLSLEKKPFLLRESISQCLAVYTGASEHKNVYLSGRVDARCPEYFTGDSTRLQQILMNLLGNAFKFTQSGYITLRVTVVDQKKLRFEVCDTGIGIAEDSVATLFDRFNQANSSTTRKFGGTGLGLAIVRDIVELWGGKVQVSSKLGEGSTFSFDLPLEEICESPKAATGKYLVCSRHDTLAKLWREEPTSPDMTWVQDMTSFQNALVRDSFDHLIVEQRFTDTPGSELIEWAKKKSPDIHATLVGFEKYIKNARSNDAVDKFLVRPYLVNQFWDDSFKRSSVAILSDSTRWPDYHSLNILCVDDNQSNLIVLRGLLKKFNIAAHCVQSGRVAIERCEKMQFDLILMDYEMPDMDGPETTRRIQAISPHLVIGLSAHTGDEYKTIAEEAGMSGFLRKPIRVAELANLLGQHFTAEKTAQ